MEFDSPEAAVERAIKERRTVRRFRSGEVGRRAVERLLKLACMAPSPHNCQPWRFAVLTDRAWREKLARVMGEAWRADQKRDGVPSQVSEARVAASFRNLSEAGALIVVCLDRSDLDSYPDRARQEAELAMAGQSLGAAIQNLLLGAHASGLGSGWRCAPLFCPDPVRECLGLDAGWEPQALVLIGASDQHPPAPPRKKMSEITLFLGGSR